MRCLQPSTVTTRTPTPSMTSNFTGSFWKRLRTEFSVGSGTIWLLSSACAPRYPRPRGTYMTARIRTGPSPTLSKKAKDVKRVSCCEITSKPNWSISRDLNRTAGRKEGPTSLFPAADHLDSLHLFRNLLPTGQRDRRGLLRFTCFAERALGDCHRRRIRKRNWCRSDYGQRPGLA